MILTSTPQGAHCILFLTIYIDWVLTAMNIFAIKKFLTNTLDMQTR